MLDIKEVKKLLGDEDISDDEAKALRDACYELAGIIVDHWRWQRERRQLRHSEGAPSS